MWIGSSFNLPVLMEDRKSRAVEDNAVIVARYIAGDMLSRRMIWGMTALYLVATGVTLSQFATDFFRNLDYQSRLTSMGFEFFYPLSLVTSITVLQGALFVGGTVATVYFLLGRRSLMFAGGSMPETSAG